MRRHSLLFRYSADPADAHLLAVADNRVAAEATWDDAMLAAVLADLKAQGHELAATGFDSAELDKLLTDATGGPGAEAPEPELSRADELRKKWGTEPGQRWLMPSRSVPGGHHVLLCGDSAAEADVARVIGQDRATRCGPIRRTASPTSARTRRHSRSPMTT